MFKLTYHFVPTRKIFCSHNILLCSLNIISCSHNLSFCSHKKDILFLQRIILFPQYITLASVVSLSVRTSLTVHSKTFSETTGPIRTKLGNHSSWVVQQIRITHMMSSSGRHSLPLNPDYGVMIWQYTTSALQQSQIKWTTKTRLLPFLTFIKETDNTYNKRN